MNRNEFDTLIWSVVDAAAELPCGEVLDGMILPGIYGESIVRDSEGLLWVNAYIWTDKLTTPIPFQCPKCREWFGTGRECYHRAPHAAPYNVTRFCVPCADGPAEHEPPKGWADAGYAGPLDLNERIDEHFAQAAMANASAAPYGWEYAAGGC